LPTLPLHRPSTLRTAWLHWSAELQYHADVMPELAKTPSDLVEGREFILEPRGGRLRIQNLWLRVAGPFECEHQSPAK
jgi:hypothetical protein